MLAQDRKVLVTRTLPDGDSYIHRRCAAQHRDRHRFANPIASKPGHQLLGIVNPFAIEGDDDVADEKAGGLGRTLPGDLADQ